MIETIKQIADRLSLYFKEQFPLSNVFNEKDIIRQIFKGIAFRFFEYQNYILESIKQLYPNTSNFENNKNIWGNIFQVEPIVATKSKGIATFTGVGTIPANTQLQDINSNLYYTTDNIILSNKILSITSLTQNYGVAIIIFPSKYYLANGMTITIVGANESLYNGEKVISLIDDFSVSFSIDLIAPSVATGDITINLNYGFGMIESNEFGNYNLDYNNTLKLITLITNIDETVYIDYTGIIDGVNEETEEEYNLRVVDTIRNPMATMSNEFIRTKVLTVENITRCIVLDNTPSVGYCTIYAIKDNNIIKSLSTLDIEKIKAILEPYTNNQWNLDFCYILNPTLITVNITFLNITPNYVTLKEVVKQNLQDFFINRINIGDIIKLDEIKSIIYNSFDPATNSKVINFSLSNPNNDIFLTQSQIAILGEITI